MKTCKVISVAPGLSRRLIIHKFDDEQAAIKRMPYIKHYERMEFKDEIRYYSPATKKYYTEYWARYWKTKEPLPEPIYR
jgi:hypothetical protein